MLVAAIMNDEREGDVPERRRVDSVERVFRATTPAAIPAGGILDLPVLVFGLRDRVGSIAVELHLRHRAVRTLSLAVVRPDGRCALLSALSGGNADSLGESCARPLVFQDHAPAALDALAPPYAGPCRPAESLDALAHGSVERLNGCWRLVISDVGEHRPGALLACAALVFRS